MKRFGLWWGTILAAGLLARVAYVIVQPAFDPTFHRPMLDGAYYLDWGKAIAEGNGAFGGVYYLGPLYPLLLSAFTQGQDVDFGFLYILQHLLMVSAAAALGLTARTLADDRAALAATALALLYHPALYFASRPLSEPVGIALLAWGLWAVVRGGRGVAGAGVLAGLSALARPSFLPVPFLWAGVLAFRRKGGAALLLLAAAAAAVAPATVRNVLVSGHLVPVSANAGIVLWLGNAPGALGIYTPVEGFSGQLATQQAEAVALASARAGRNLDAVEADRYWRDEAIRTRLADPAGTALLFLRRAGLTLDNAEHGLDYAPSLDRNPLRWTAPLPFAVLLGLAVFGGWTRGGGRGWGPVWTALLACAATPLVFYVSSRHRLPLAMILCLPAAAAFARETTRVPAARAWTAAVAGTLAAALSLAVPTGGIVRTQQAGALANLSVVHKAVGNLPAAERTARRALDLDPSSEPAAYNLAVVLEATGRPGEAVDLYRRIVAWNPGNAEAAGNLAALLVKGGRPEDAIPILREALVHRPGSGTCWANLVVALASAGDLEGAREAAGEARAREVSLDPGLLDAIGYPGDVRTENKP